jgi:hypothetical protein
MLADLEELPTVRSRADRPLQLAPPRSIYRGVIIAGQASATAFGPIDTARLLDLHQSVGSHKFDSSAASDMASPLFALYQGPKPIDRQGVRTVNDLLERNPEGHVIVFSLHASDTPEPSVR